MRWFSIHSTAFKRLVLEYVQVHPYYFVQKLSIINLNYFSKQNQKFKIF